MQAPLVAQQSPPFGRSAPRPRRFCSHRPPRRPSRHDPEPERHTVGAKGCARASVGWWLRRRRRPVGCTETRTTNSTAAANRRHLPPLLLPSRDDESRRDDDQRRRNKDRDEDHKKVAVVAVHDLSSWLMNDNTLGGRLSSLVVARRPADSSPCRDRQSTAGSFNHLSVQKDDCRRRPTIRPSNLSTLTTPQSTTPMTDDDDQLEARRVHKTAPPIGDLRSSSADKQKTAADERKKSSNSRRHDDDSMRRPTEHVVGRRLVATNRRRRLMEREAASARASSSSRGRPPSQRP